MRHPTCASGIIMTLGTGLMSPIWWNALAPAVVTVAYVLKTRYEDSYLAANLAGY